jgi:hypothetical protein
MIEFKAECGHTVRARDEDAGGSVRCSYCGRPANVPQNDGDGLDLLLRETDLAARPPLHVPAPRKGLFGRIFRRAGGAAWDPWPTIMRMIYFAALLSVVIVITNKFVLPLFDTSQRHSPTAANGAHLSEEGPSERRRRPPNGGHRPAETGRGLVHRNLLSGLLVLSVPDGATVFVVPADQAPSVGRIHRINGVVTGRSGGNIHRIHDGNYVVEVAVAWNDPALKRYEGYTEFRREVERASQNQRRQLVEDFFVPDEASAVFFDESEEQKFIVRQYRNVEVRDGRSQGVRAVFLPRIRRGDEPGFAVEPLVVNYLPEMTNFVFDEKDALDELDYYGVRNADRPWMIKGLARIGIMPYVTPARRVMVFKVGLEDGLFIARVLREGGK